MYEILKENYGKSSRKKKNLICYCSKIKALLKLFNCMASKINIMHCILFWGFYLNPVLIQPILRKSTNTSLC